MIHYLQATRGLKITLEANGMHVVKLWIDAAHVLHPDIRGHTENMMSLEREGQGAVYSDLSKKNQYKKFNGNIIIRIE